jgi:hypothetical protein
MPVRFHPAALSSKLKRVLRRVGPIVTPWGFYLGGGTALALWLGHRRSIDLDWFVEKKISDPLRLARDLVEGGLPFVTQSEARGTLHGTISGVRVTFLDYRYPALRPIVHLAVNQCNVASLADLSAMKLSAIAQRGAKKDFVDLHGLIEHGLTLRQMLTWYQKKFQVKDLSHLLSSLSYFADADAERMPKLLRPMDWRQCKATIRQLARITTSPE